MREPEVTLNNRLINDAVADRIVRSMKELFGGALAFVYIGGEYWEPVTEVVVTLHDRREFTFELDRELVEITRSLD